MKNAVVEKCMQLLIREFDLKLWTWPRPEANTVVRKLACWIGGEVTSWHGKSAGISLEAQRSYENMARAKYISWNISFFVMQSCCTCTGGTGV